MNMVKSRQLGKCLVLLAVNCVLYSHAVNANDWQADKAFKPGFSEFSPPSSGSTKFRNKYDSREWESGRSFNEENKVRYAPSASKNPWKPLRTSFSKKTFGGKRPWGNVPDRKPPASNMKLQDQRFKQWISQRDSSYRNFSAYSDPFSNFGYSSLMYNDPLITPSVYPGSVLGYPGGRYPYGGFLPGSRFW
ncbi:MAG: hypothetical protein OEM07_06315 [Gammaproteobacteria bacterium]|nr:hypothetical protein [Gammaproteobacteria bacterium]